MTSKMTLLSLLICLGMTFSICVEAGQLPLALNDIPASVEQAWDSPPHPDDVGHLIFDTAGNLLKKRSNDWYPNGHTVIPAMVTPGTLLFHGRMDDQPPPGPEWLSFDSDFSLVYTSMGPGHGYLFTYAATRELRVLYFDGSSAAKRPSGTIDSQDIVSYGRVTDDWGWNSERKRIAHLCSWGKPYNLDGFLRMNMNFEIMLCNFTHGLEIVSHIPILPFGSGPRLPDRRPAPKPSHPPPGWRGSLRSPISGIFEALQSGSLHNFFPVTGVRLDYSRHLTFYDSKFMSLVFSRRTVGSRARHRLLNMSREDAHWFQSELHEVLMRPADQRGSGVDWGELIRHIVERNVGRLDFLGYLLRSVDGDADPHQPKEEAFNSSEIVRDVRLQILTMLSPYLSRASVPPVGKVSMTNGTWLTLAMKHCSSSYTSHLRTSLFTPQERLIKSSIDETVGQICRTLGLIWMSAFSAESIVAKEERVSLLITWKAELKRLTDWLGWAQWVKCDPVCAEDELCALPQLPMDGVPETYAPFCISKLHWD